MLDPRPAYRYSLADLRQWLSQAVLQKGSVYVSRISGVSLESNSISALVQGREAQPYRVEIHFLAAARPSMLCTCPVGIACKHVAAVMLKALNGRDQPAAGINPVVLQWIDDLRRSRMQTPKKSVNKRDAIFYVIEPATASRRPAIVFYKGRPDAEGQPGASTSRWENVERALLQPPAFVDENDIIALRHVWMQRPKGYGWGPITLSGKGLDVLMRALLATGRVYYPLEFGLLHVHEGSARRADLVWQALDENWTTAQLRVQDTEGAKVIAGEQPWFIDPAKSELGPLVCDVPAHLLARVFDLPPLSRQDRVVLGAVLDELAPGVPSPAAAAALKVIDIAPRPILRLTTIHPWSMQKHKAYDYAYDKDYDLAYPLFAYEDLSFAVDDRHEFVSLSSGEAVKVNRRYADEQRYMQDLEQVGLSRISPHLLNMSRGPAPDGAWGLQSEAAWSDFIRDGVPALRASGWFVDMPADFRHQRLDVTAWHADLRDQGNGWFDLDLGIDVEDQRVPLAPLLSSLFAREPRWLSASELSAINDDEDVDLLLPNGSRVRVAAGRIKPLACTLIDLFDGNADGALRVSTFDAERLQQLDDPARWQFRGDQAVAAMVQRLQAAEKLQPATLPQGFTLQLRPYQMEGLAWLQYLREHDLAGILADDMGLGKTAQALAHLLVEKQAGRLDRPALVVLPTSLVFNWKREAAAVAPGLRVLSLHGGARAALFASIADYDVVLTTYPLVWRDVEALKQQPWHLLILDEAQTVKNVASRAAAALRQLDARHRLCLTGTPLENHLGELWAQFDFLLPGFLGDSKSFARRWRTPIEKHGDMVRRQILAQRIRPFILRRRKEDVAQELPEKTIVVRTVELSGGQRDLYETVRATVDDGVKQMIANRGFKRSQIVILDALLKLRQVCCDPRLVSLPSARAVKESAKLELLADMLPELVSEGRRILLFSQFTQMLDLIVEQLHRQKLRYVRLDGQTQDREAVVGQFQNGDVPIFLLSLKAGGVGLNLTAADTVIHFDPWWNPAAENQATDRAHRLGQDKSVFVYKLVVAGSIEERIVALQERKAELADGILSNDGALSNKFGSDDLLALLAPLS